MIHSAVKYIVDELNAYLKLRSSLTTDQIVQGPLLEQNGNVHSAADNKVVLSMVNIEEERLFRQVDLMQRQDDGTYHRVQPEVRVNLYLLFIANLSVYEEALKATSHIISFFQHRNTFDYAEVEGLADKRGKLIFDLHSLTFEEQNHLWGALGAKYLPSVMYKMRVITLQDEQIEAEVQPVQEIHLNT